VDGPAKAILPPLRRRIHPDAHRLLVAGDGDQLARILRGEGLEGGADVGLVAGAREERPAILLAFDSTSGRLR